MKYVGGMICFAGFFLMMAGVGTIEADNSIVGIELIIWSLISLIGVLSFGMGALILNQYWK